jgi:hypothetical protein
MVANHIHLVSVIWIGFKYHINLLLFIVASLLQILPCGQEDARRQSTQTFSSSSRLNLLLLFVSLNIFYFSLSNLLPFLSTVSSIVA